MTYPDAPEFQTIGPGYSPDRFYTESYLRSSNGDRGQRREISLPRGVFPAEYIARLEDLIHERKFPAYRSVQDFMRDAMVHHLHRRLEEIHDPKWTEISDSFGRYFDVERIRLEQKMTSDSVETWRHMLDDERDPRQRKRLLQRAREHLETMEEGFWRDELEEVVRRNER